MNKFRSIIARGTAAALGLAAAGAASAGPLATAFEGGVDKSELASIGGLVLGVAGIIFLIRSARRTA